MDSGLSTTESRGDLPDLGEVMVVVFGDEVQMVHQRHRGLEARVRDGFGEERWVEFIRALEELFPAGAEFCEDFFEGTGVVVGFVRSSVAQVGCG